jgi:hypothetical protein
MVLVPFGISSLCIGYEFELTPEDVCCFADTVSCIKDLGLEELDLSEYSWLGPEFILPPQVRLGLKTSVPKLQVCSRDVGLGAGHFRAIDSWLFRHILSPPFTSTLKLQGFGPWKPKS